MRRGIVLLVVFIILLVAPALLRYLNYYNLGGGIDRGQIPTYDPATVTAQPTPAAATFVDEPVAGHGSILLDVAHDNAFTLDELSYLHGRLSARGYDVITYDGGNLAAALRAVNAFVVITPLKVFTFDDVQAVKAFVAQGGRLLLIGDPTRFAVSIEEDLFEINVIIEDDKIPLNSLASEFDITFNGDYLYNLTENEGNFRNIILKGSGLGEGDLTAELTEIVFYGAHSLDVGPAATAVLRGDDNTWSSATDRPGGLTLAATSYEGHVLALSDIQFMTEPYYTSYDNSRFIARLADFLTQTDNRTFTLADFPYFYAAPVNLVYTGRPDLGPLAFDQTVALQNAFRSVGQSLTLAATVADDQNALHLGLYNQAGDDVLEILASHGITFTLEPPVLTEAEQAALKKELEDKDAEATPEPTEEESTEEAVPEEPEPVRIVHTPLGNVQMSGTALVLLDASHGRHSVIVLAASRDGLDSAVNLLLDLIPLDANYESAGCVLQENLALCPTGVADEEVEAELLTGGTAVTDADEEPEEPEEDAQPDEPVADIDAVNQGAIDLDESVEGELAEGESHAWTFSGGPAVIDILVEGNEDMDTVLELYDPNNNLITSADSTFTGEAEEIRGADIEDDGDYTIVVRDYYDDGGSYTLTVTAVEGGGDEGAAGTIENVFLFVDDDGEPIGEGITSADALLALLSETYEVTTWVSTVDGPLEEDTLAGVDLLIWDSGDYRNEEGFFDEDTFIIFEYLDGGGSLFVTGSSPTILADVELASLSDLEIIGDDPILLDGLDSGDVIELEDTYEVGLSDLMVEDSDEGTTPFLLRGPGSEGSGEIVGLAGIDDFSAQRSVLLLLPFVILPEDIQEILLTNIMTWFAEGA